VADERLLIATCDLQNGQMLGQYLASSTGRFEAACTNDGQILRQAIADDSISVVVADAEMLAWLGEDLEKSRSGPHKPVLLTPQLDCEEPASSANHEKPGQKTREQWRLFASRLNHTVDQLRRGRRDRRMSSRSAVMIPPASGCDPATGFVPRAWVGELFKPTNPGRDRRRILSCVTFKLSPQTGTSTGSELRLSSVAHRLRQRMRKCDQGIRWDNSTLVVLRPSSPLGESWLWAEALRPELEVRHETANPGAIAGLSVVEVPTAGFSDTTILMGEDAAAHSAAFEGGTIQTPMTIMLLSRGRHWTRLSQLPPRQRRRRLLDWLTLSLGAAQIEHLCSHCQTVGGLAGHIGRKCLLDDIGVESVRLAGLYHDIGKVLVPNDLLAKPGPLSRPEKALMARHVPWGAELCQRLGLEAAICHAVRDHHLRFDEAGYSVGLLGRIVCVADALATMAVQRDYSNARSLAGALAELKRERGKQFDPMVVDAACAVAADLPKKE
jgi:putative nucleotidyltransferase with HDIG domain